jgi:sporulation protein YlmC with PRC-barrel domain
MAGTADYVIGAEVASRDAICGDLSRVVVNPLARELTHLVVQPQEGDAFGKLVPIELVESTTDQMITLGCSTEDFDALDDAEETDFVPGAQGKWGYGQEQMLSFPYFGSGLATMGLGHLGAGMLSMGIDSPGMSTQPQSLTRDRVPLGEIEIRRGYAVQATDGAIGEVRGLVVDPADRQVTHVLLEEGHLWGKKDVAIPIGCVADVDEQIRLTLTRAQVKDLPEVNLDAGD